MELGGHMSEIKGLVSGLRNRCTPTIASLVTIATVFAFPFLTANAMSGCSFTMYNLVVDGCANNELHSLQPGTIYLVGQHTSSGTMPLDVELQRDRFGPNLSFGTINTTTDGMVNDTFPTPADVSSSNYCLYIWRAYDNGHMVSGIGSVT